MITRFFPILALIFTLSGCATVVDVTVYTDPPYATIYTLRGGQNLGVSPFQTSVSFSDEDVKLGYKTFDGLEARWRSGASATVPRLTVKLDRGSTQNMTIRRPDSPGREIDLQYADQRRREAIGLYSAILKQQAESDKIRAYEARTKAISEAEKQRQFQNRSYNCTSTQSGNSVYTNCQ